MGMMVNFMSQLGWVTGYFVFWANILRAPLRVFLDKIDIEK